MMAKQSKTDVSVACEPQRGNQGNAAKQRTKPRRPKPEGSHEYNHGTWERALEGIADEALSLLECTQYVNGVANSFGFLTHDEPDLHHGCLNILFHMLGLRFGGRENKLRCELTQQFDSQTNTSVEFIHVVRDAVKSLNSPPKKPRFDPDLSHLCESPIEIMFYDACAVSHAHQRAVFGREFEVEKAAFGSLRPNYQIGPYRVDFAVVAHRIAVELDGHDWHKTKEQRTSDAERERHIENNGWLVVRFTGSEVFKNASLCVEELENAISHHGDGGTYGRDISKIKVFGPES